MVEKQTFSRSASREDRDFADNMKRIREIQGWSQGELARRIGDFGLEGFHQTTISRIEKGERLVRLGEARTIARALGRPVDHLLLPRRDVEPLEAFALDLEEALTAYGRATRSLVDYESALSALRKHVRAAEEKLQRGPDAVPYGRDLERLVQKARPFLRKNLSNLQEWATEGIYREPVEEEQIGEHPEEA